MTRLKLSWRRLGVLAALGLAATSMPALAQNPQNPAAATSRTTHLTAETSGLSQPGAAGQTAAPIIANPAPANHASPAAVAQRATYQQPQNTAAEPPPSPTNRLMNQYDTANRAYMAEPMGPMQSPEPIVSNGMPGGCGAGGCGVGGACGAGGCGTGGCGTGCNCNQGGSCLDCCDPYFYNDGWYVGLEFLHLRPNFSSPAAAVQRTTFVDPTTNASIISDDVIEYDIGYDPTFRVFGGYRWGDCGESLEFSYWQVDTDESFTSPPATATVFFAGFEDAIADAPGEVLRSDFDVELNVADFEYAKRTRIAKGNASQCGGCCPAWDWGWSMGARIADYEREHNNQVVNAAGVVLSAATTNTSFTGAGPRAGIEGRRYFGERGLWSAYGSTHLSLLLGDFDVTSSRTAGITTTNASQGFIRTVPVTELEVGVSRQIGCRTLFSIGYQFQAWWEIGRFDTIMIGDCECLTSSNVLSLDGLFVRLEHTFGPHCRSQCCP